MASDAALNWTLETREKTGHSDRGMDVGPRHRNHLYEVNGKFGTGQIRKLQSKCLNRRIKSAELSRKKKLGASRVTEWQ